MPQLMQMMNAARPQGGQNLVNWGNQFAGMNNAPPNPWLNGQPGASTPPPVNTGPPLFDQNAWRNGTVGGGQSAPPPASVPTGAPSGQAGLDKRAARQPLPGSDASRGQVVAYGGPVNPIQSPQPMGGLQQGMSAFVPPTDPKAIAGRLAATRPPQPMGAPAPVPFGGNGMVAPPPNMAFAQAPQMQPQSNISPTGKVQGQPGLPANRMPTLSAPDQNGNAIAQPGGFQQIIGDWGMNPDGSMTEIQRGRAVRQSGDQNENAAMEESRRTMPQRNQQGEPITQAMREQQARDQNIQRFNRGKSPEAIEAKKQHDLKYGGVNPNITDQDRAARGAKNGPQQDNRPVEMLAQENLNQRLQEFRSNPSLASGRLKMMTSPGFRQGTYMTPLQRQLDQQEIASLRQMTGASPQGSSGGIPQATANDMAAMNARGAQQRIQAAGVQLPDWWLQMQEESNRHYGGQGGPTPLMDQNLSEFGGLQGAERHFTQNLRRW